MNYWNKRRKMLYYKKIIEIINKIKPDSILDVGNGGCPYIENNFSSVINTIDTENAYASDKVKSIICDFMLWDSNLVYDLVVCSQVIEHILNPNEFVKKLFKHGRTILISVPYKWPEGTEKEHIHDPIDESKIFSWVGFNPGESHIITENVRNKSRKDISRIICLYSIS